MQERKSPFVLAVPVGRWVDKKERTAQIRVQPNDTPVRKVLLSERILKRSTVKKLIEQSTAKKENVMIFGQKAPSQPTAVKSKKRILGELNAVKNAPRNDDPMLIADSLLEPMGSELNSTFEITPHQSIKEKQSDPKKNLRRSKSMPDISTDAKVKGRKMLSPPVKAVAKKVPVQKARPLPRAVTFKLAVAQKPVQVPFKKTTNTMFQLKNKSDKTLAKPDQTAKPTRKKLVQANQEVVDEPVLEIQRGAKQEETAKPSQKEVAQANQEVAELEIQRGAKKKQPVYSSTYNLYKSSLDIQSSYLKMQIGELMKNKDMFFEVLSEDQQIYVHKVFQQGNLLISDKLKKFQQLLDKFEASLSQPNDPKALTAEDVENYWYLIYDEIEVLKSELIKAHEMKNGALAIVASQRKRRTRKTYVPEDGTPRRSRRIVEIGGTPK